MNEATLLSLFLLGLSYGSTACMFTCLPFLSPLLLTKSSNIQESFSVLIPFSLGRITTYITIAILSASSALYVKSLIKDQTLAQNILGSVTVVVALFILKNALSNRASSCCSTNSSKKDVKNSIGYFFMGAGISFNPCLPVMTLITTSAYASSSLQAASFGAVFGLGAVAASFLVFGVILSKVAKGFVEEFQNYKKGVEVTAGLLLLIVGLFTFNGMFHLG